jgi:AcrR family transcriptional regulator
VTKKTSDNETRRRIVFAADSLFYAKGINNVSLDQIADAAKLTKKAIYYHFASKDELVAGRAVASVAATYCLKNVRTLPVPAISFTETPYFFAW